MTGLAIPLEPGVKRAHYVRLSTDLPTVTPRVGQAGSISLNLFTDLEFEAITDRIEPTPRGATISYGHLNGIADGSFILASQDGVLAGSIFVPGRGAIKITYAGGGLHRVAELDPATQPICGLTPQRPLTAPNGAPAATLTGTNVSQRQTGSESDLPAGGAPAGSGTTNTPITTIDVMVIYSAQARDAAGGTQGMNTLIELAIAEANLSYLNSHVNIQVSLVYRGLIDYPETGQIGTDLDQLTSVGDGFLDDVPALRSRYRADLVALIVEGATSYGYAGIANIMTVANTSFASSAFCVVRRPYLSGNFSLAHEMGHNMGCDHAREDSTAPTHAYPYAFGNKFAAGGFSYRTVMAYNPGLQIPYFSNPDVSFQGVPTGVADNSPNSADNARVINNTASIVAAFQPRAARLEFSAPLFSVSQAGGTATVSVQRTEITNVAVSVDYATSDGSGVAGHDYIAQSGTLNFASGETQKTVTVQIIDQVTTDGNLSVNVKLSNPIGNAILGQLDSTLISIVPTAPPPPSMVDAAFNPGSGADGLVDAIAIQTNGAVVIGGAFASINGSVRNRIARLNPDGSVDSAYDPGRGVKYRIHSIALQADQKAIIGGEFNTVTGTNRNAIARLGANGLLDPTFDPGDGTMDFIYSVVMDTNITPAGVFIGGSFTTFTDVTRNYVARLKLDGSLDAGFDPGAGPNDVVDSIALQNDRKLVIGGAFTTVSGVGRNHIARLNSDGTLDATFNPRLGANDTVECVALAANGQILIGGAFTSYNGFGRNRIARLSADGSLDSSFSPMGADDVVLAIAALANGQVLVGGVFTHFNSFSRAHVARLFPDGTLDASFNDASGPNDSVFAIAPQGDGKVVIGGLFTTIDGATHNYIARLNPVNQSVATPGQLSSPRRLPDGSISVTLATEPGQTYTLQASADLQTWLPVITVTPAGNYWNFIDSAAIGATQRFYRARVGP